jgi:hypothetical protein
VRSKGHDRAVMETDHPRHSELEQHTHEASAVMNFIIVASQFLVGLFNLSTSMEYKCSKTSRLYSKLQ